ncbi:MAG: M1 family metallopeptidase [Bacteroidota bacterium]
MKNDHFKFISKGLFCSIFFCITSFCSFNLFAQEKSYFQQKANYKIDVFLNDFSNTLHAIETIEYTNNSADTLREIYFHIWANAYKNNSTEFAKQQLALGSDDFYFSSKNDKGFIDSLDFTVNKEKVQFEINKNQIDVCKITLNQALLPKQTIIISTPFKVKIPNQIFSRSGRDGNMFQLTQWYPKPAVYDKNGWNLFSYTDQGEFYSEFGKFDVTITAPEKYIIAATGILKAENKINGTIIQNYQLDSIHDFAWFASPDFNYAFDEITIPETGKKVKIQTYNLKTDTSKIWDNTLEYIKKTIITYSELVGPYPYSVASVVESADNYGGGMEYPSICILSPSSDAKSHELLVAHEVGHNWFYGIIGSNENLNPWMDEGINSFYEYSYCQKFFPNTSSYIGNFSKLLKINPLLSAKIERQAIYLALASLHTDQAANLAANKYNTANYTGIVYEKVASSFIYLKAYLGDSVFDKCIKSYYAEWAFKHPDPKDIKAVFERISNKDLSWFFDDIIGTTKRPDYALKSLLIQQEANIAILKLKNKSNFTGPFSISTYKDHNLISKQWFNGFKTKKYTVGIPYNNATKFVIDSDFETFDLNRKNNVCNVKKKINLHLKFLTGIDCFEKREVYYSPILAWNLYDHWMFGAAIYNKNIFVKNTEYLIAPLYSYSTSTLNGIASISHSFYQPVSFLQRINIELNSQTFIYSNYKSNLHYTKLQPQLTFNFKKKNALSPLLNQIKLSYYSINEDMLTKSNGNYIKTNKINDFGRISYTLNNEKTINQNKLIANIELNKSFQKAYIELFQKIAYTQEKSMDIRLFAGAFIWQETKYYGNYNFRMSGQTGYQDYLYDNIHFARSEQNGMLSQQFSITDGGFKSFTYVGQSNKWIASVNIESDIPGILPIRLFADFGTYERADKVFTESQLVPFDAGISIQLFSKTLKIYIPLLYSSDIKYVNNLNNFSFLQQIRFIIDFEKINVWKMRENYLK